MMIRFCFQHLALAIVCAIACSAHAQAVPAEGGATTAAHRFSTVSPGLEEDPAPLMKVQVLSRSSQETTYAVIFGKGDEVMGGLTEFAQKNHLGASRITGIGGIEDATVGFFDPAEEVSSAHANRSAGGSAFPAGRHCALSGQARGSSPHCSWLSGWHRARRTFAESACLANDGGHRYRIPECDAQEIGPVDRSGGH